GPFRCGGNTARGAGEGAKRDRPSAPGACGQADPRATGVQHRPDQLSGRGTVLVRRRDERLEEGNPGGEGRPLELKPRATAGWTKPAVARRPYWNWSSIRARIQASIRTGMEFKAPRGEDTECGRQR